MVPDTETLTKSLDCGLPIFNYAIAYDTLLDKYIDKYIDKSIDKSIDKYIDKYLAMIIFTYLWCETIISGKILHK